MTRYSSFRLLLVGLVAIAVELTVAERVCFRGGRPELLLLLACFAALFASETRQGLVVAWVFGLAKDLGSAAPLGFHALLFLGVAWGILRLRKVVFREHPLLQFGIVFAGALGVEALAAAFVSVFVGGIPFWTWLVKALSASLLSAALAPLVMGALLRWRSFLRPHG